MTARPASLSDLTRMGAEALECYRERANPPTTPLEWIGIAVLHLPELMGHARTADSVQGRSRSQSAELRATLLDALLVALGEAAATVEAARASLVERRPDAPGDNGDAEGYAEILEAAHADSPRRAERMIAGYASFLSAAIEAAGCLAAAEVSAARARRWDREDHEHNASVRAAQMHTALTDALGGLLAYARLVATDQAQLSD